MRLFCFLLILSGCAYKRGPQINDTNFKTQDLNWEKIYATELRIAIENEDIEAWYFFREEYVKELLKKNNKNILKSVN